MLSSVPNVQPTEPMYSVSVETLDLSDATQPAHGARLPRISLSCHQGRKEWHVFDCAKHLELKPKVNRFIRQQYFLAHGANLGDLMANLYALEEQDGTLLGAVGLDGFGEPQRLVECYLKQPAEVYLSRHLGFLVSREQVMEAGNLAATNLTGAVLLTAFLFDEANRQQKTWALFTATSAVRLALKRIGIPYESLLSATMDCVSGDYGSWGTYYEQDPQVVLVNISEGLAAVNKKYAIRRFF